MTTAIELAEIGMINDMQLLNAISHNLANANTPGYKRDIAVSTAFESLLGTGISAQLSGLGTGGRQLVPDVELLVDHAGGTLQHTGNPLDLAIEGAAYFEVLTESGPRYSRSGEFGVDSTGRLVSNHGFPVAGAEGDILLGGGDVVVHRDGSIFEDGNYAGQLKLVSFDSPGVLAKEGRGLMRAVEGAVAQIDDNGGIRQGYRETSNVDAMQEMVLLMSTLRHFEMTSRVLKGYDDMVNTAISTIADF